MTWIQFIIILLVLIIGFAKIYFKGYFSEWGKNAATKKDIEEITNKVEAVKITFTKEIEHLRGDLLFKNTIKGMMYADKKDSIIKLYESIHLWFETIENHLVSGLEYDKNKIIAAEQEIEKYEFNVSIAESKAELYITDEKFFDLVHSYWESIDKLETLVLHQLIEYDKLHNQMFQYQNDKYEAQKKIHRETFEKSRMLRDEIHSKWPDFRDACFKKISSP